LFRAADTHSANVIPDVVSLEKRRSDVLEWDAGLVIELIPR
jgi:hypothetical protein